MASALIIGFVRILTFVYKSVIIIIFHDIAQKWLVIPEIYHILRRPN